MARSRGAGAHAGRFAILKGEILVVDAINAERAFFHHAMVIVVFPGAIGASPGAQFAADAGVGIDEHDAVLGTLVGRTRRADRYAGRILAMKARAREMHDVRVGLHTRFAKRFIGVDAIEPGSQRVGIIGISVAQRRGIPLCVPFLTARGASMTADAGVEVDYEAELLLASCGGVGKGGHGRPS